MATNANKKIKQALQGNNKLTKSEIQNLNNAGISTAKILTVAAKNDAVIGQQAQNAFNIDQNKQGVISYTPGVMGVAPTPGSGWAITGSQTTQPITVNGGSSKASVPTYTFMGSGGASPKGASPYQGMMNGANDQGPPPPPGGANPGGATGNWADSVDAGTQAMIDAINASVAQNQANQDLYMGMINDLMGQMSAANTQQQQQQMSAGPYAVMTTTSAPVQGAQVTQAISRRLKNLNTSLAISPTEAATAGTGLNIPV